MVFFSPIMAPRRVLAVSPTVTYLSFQSSTSNASQYTFNSVAIGNAAADRLVVVSPGASSTQHVTAVTIGGVSATAHTDTSGGDPSCEIWSATVPTGTTAQIVVTLSGSANRMGMGVWTITDLNSATPIDSDKVQGGSTNASRSLTVNVEEDGVVIVAGGRNMAGAITPTNYTERYDSSVESNDQFSGGDNVPASTGTKQYTMDAVASMSVVSWR